MVNGKRFGNQSLIGLAFTVHCSPEAPRLMTCLFCGLCVLWGEIFNGI
jgi:hypothetical protein